MLSIQEHIFLTSANIVAVGVSSDNNSTQPWIKKSKYYLYGDRVSGYA